MLLQVVTQLGADTDPHEIDVHRGVAGRQIVVSIASFDPDDPQVRELQDVRERLAAFPWDRLVETRGRDDRAAPRGDGAGRRSPRSGSTSCAASRRSSSTRSRRSSLTANQHGQFALAALVTLVLGLGIAGITVVLRRSRSDVGRAFAALKGEVDERRVAEEALRASEGRFRSLVQRASDLTIVTDDHGVVTYVSPAVEALVGYRPEDFLELPLLVHVEPEERADVATAITLLAERPGLVRTIELRLRTADGRTRSVEAVCQNLVDDPDVGGLVWNGRDVTERKALESELNHRAHHDPLTGLPNRALLLQRLAETLASPRVRAATAVGGRRRPRRVQERQRHPRPRGRRRAAAGGRAAPARLRPGRRHRRAAGRRRVRRHDLFGGPRTTRWRSPAGSSTSCTSRSPSPATTSPSAPASASRTAAAPGRRTGCCATPTSRCTSRSGRARAGSRSSSRRCG